MPQAVSSDKWLTGVHLPLRLVNTCHCHRLWIHWPCPLIYQIMPIDVTAQHAKSCWLLRMRVAAPFSEWGIAMPLAHCCLWTRMICHALIEYRYAEEAISWHWNFDCWPDTILECHVLHRTYQSRYQYWPATHERKLWMFWWHSLLLIRYQQLELNRRMICLDLCLDPTQTWSWIDLVFDLDNLILQLSPCSTLHTPLIAPVHDMTSRFCEPCLLHEPMPIAFAKRFMEDIMCDHDLCAWLCPDLTCLCL